MHHHGLGSTMPRSWQLLVSALLIIILLHHLFSLDTRIKQRSLHHRLAQHFQYDVSSAFPTYIWQTWRYGPASSEFTMGLKTSTKTWDKQNPNATHEILTDAVAEELLKDLYNPFPEVIEAYKALPKPVLKADFFRYLILLAKGGVYTDIDTHALKPASSWVPDEESRQHIGLVVGIEADPDREDWHQWYSRRIQFCQWTIQAKAGHPVLREIVANITQETLRLKTQGTLDDPSLSVLELTGPGVWTDVVFRHFNDRRQITPTVTWQTFTGLRVPRAVQDVLVLPITSFSPGVGHMGSGNVADPLAFVRHDFSGSWKIEGG